MSSNELRMNAYYYGFDLTGAPEIDLILSAVACAGKSFHHTDQWNDQSDPWPSHSGNSPAEWIQNAAIIAADGNRRAQELINKLKTENESLRKAVDFAAEAFGKITSSDGSGHADLAVAVLRIAGKAMVKDSAR